MNSIVSAPNRPCPVCGHELSRPWRKKFELELSRCPVCGMVFQPVFPEEFESSTFYHRASAYYLSPDKLGGDLSPVRYERELRLFRSEVPCGTVLDVGCGTGGFLHQLGRRHAGDYNLVGTDVAGPALDHAEGFGLQILRGSFPALQGHGESFDAVTFWAVLEHLVEPHAFLEQAWRVLRPGGVCIALVPNMESLAVRLLGMKYRYILPQHLNYFARSTLLRLCLRTAPWNVRNVRFTHFNPLVVWQDFRGGTRFVSDQDRAALLTKTTRLKQRSEGGFVRLAYGIVERALACLRLTDNLAVVLQKPS